MSENIKLQSPILNGNQGVYPLTTYDQIILADGSRWNGKTIKDSDNIMVIDAEGEETETVTPVNAETFSGMTYKQIMELEHGVGSFYFTMSALDDPNSKWDWMTWELVTDKFLLGAGASYEVGAEGGATTTTFNNNNLPSPDIILHKNTTGASLTVSGFEKKNITVAANSWVALTNYDAKQAGLLASYGQAINNMPPYLSIFMWTRTA